MKLEEDHFVLWTELQPISNTTPCLIQIEIIIIWLIRIRLLIQYLQDLLLTVQSKPAVGLAWICNCR